MFRKVITLTLGLGLIVPGVQAGKKRAAATKSRLSLQNEGFDAEALENLLNGLEPEKKRLVWRLDIRNNNIDRAVDLSMLPNLHKVYYQGNKGLEEYLQRGGSVEKWFTVHAETTVEFWANPKAEEGLIEWRAAGVGVAIGTTVVAMYAFGDWLNNKYGILDRIRYRFIGQTLPEVRRREIVHELKKVALELAEKKVSKAEFKEFERRTEEKLRATFGFSNFELIARDSFNAFMEESKLRKYILVEAD